MVFIDNATTHGAIFDSNACVTAAEFGYLNGGVLPSRDVVCKAGPMRSFGMQDSVTYEYGYPALGSWLPLPPDVRGMSGPLVP